MGSVSSKALSARDNAAGARPPNSPEYGMAKDYSYNNTLFATGGCINLATEAQKFSFEPDAKCKFYAGRDCITEIIVTDSMAANGVTTLPQPFGSYNCWFEEQWVLGTTWEGK